MDLDKLLKERELSCNDLAKRTGIARQYLYDIAAGRKDWKRVTYGKLESIAQALGISLDELVNS